MRNTNFDEHEAQRQMCETLILLYVLYGRETIQILSMMTIGYYKRICEIQILVNIGHKAHKFQCKHNPWI
jgi:hypothetical protein